MPLTAQDIFNLSDRERCRFRFAPRKRGRYRQVERPKRTRDELVSYLRDNNIRSSRQLERKRRDGDPVLSDYRLAFDKWSDAVTLAFGRTETVIPVGDPEYMAKLSLQFGVTSVRRYLEARRLRPDIVPSYNELKRKWGGFRGLKLFLRRYSTLVIFNSYLALRRKLGRYPTLEESRDRGIHLDAVLKLFGSKKKFDAFLDGTGGQK